MALLFVRTCPSLKNSPDGTVVDFGCQNHVRLSEVKCPETKYHITPLDACQDRSSSERLKGTMQTRKNSFLLCASARPHWGY